MNGPRLRVASVTKRRGSHVPTPIPSPNLTAGLSRGAGLHAATRGVCGITRWSKRSSAAPAVREGRCMRPSLKLLGCPPPGLSGGYMSNGGDAMLCPPVAVPLYRSASIGLEASGAGAGSVGLRSLACGRASGRPPVWWCRPCQAPMRLESEPLGVSGEATLCDPGATIAPPAETSGRKRGPM